MTVLNIHSGKELHWDLDQDPTKMVRWSNDTMFGGEVKGSLRTIAHLDWMSDRAVKHFGQRIVVIQAPYNTSVEASKGTHDLDSCKDWYIPGVGWWLTQRFGRVHGDGCYYRHPPLFGNHIHGFTLPHGQHFQTKVGVYIDGGMSLYGRIVASSQLADYYAHRNALADHSHDGSWFPKDISATVFNFQLFLHNKRHH
jgi:hypothetical protein